MLESMYAALRNLLAEELEEKLSALEQKVMMVG
jgi:hypothetical protein